MNPIHWLSVAAPFAYLDPGTGSYLLQLLVAGALGLGFLLKVYWGKIKVFFSNLFHKKTVEPDEDPKP